jgi:hypothetical protein
LDRSGAEASEDGPPSRVWKVRSGWRDDQAEVEAGQSHFKTSPRV